MPLCRTSIPSSFLFLWKNTVKSAFRSSPARKPRSISCLPIIIARKSFRRPPKLVWLTRKQHLLLEGLESWLNVHSHRQALVHSKSFTCSLADSVMHKHSCMLRHRPQSVLQMYTFSVQEAFCFLCLLLYTMLCFLLYYSGQNPSYSLFLAKRIPDQTEFIILSLTRLPCASIIRSKC